MDTAWKLEPSLRESGPSQERRSERLTSSGKKKESPYPSPSYSPIGESSSSSEEAGAGNRREEIDYLRKECNFALEELATESMLKATEYFKGAPGGEEKKIDYYKRHFVSLCQLGSGSAGRANERVALKLHELTLAKMEELGGHLRGELIKAKRFCIPHESFQELIGIALLCESWESQEISPLSPLKEVPGDIERAFSGDELPPYSNTKAWVKEFNKNDGKREELRPKALKMLEHMRFRAWNWNGAVATVPKAAEVANIRHSLFAMFSCSDQKVQIRALEYLIELLEADPLTKESASGIVKLLNNIREKVTIKDVEEIETDVQRPLVRAYALCLENILLQGNLGRLNGVTQESRDEIWDRANEYQSLNIEDEDINFWTKYAVQAAQRIKTDVAEWEDWARRFIEVANALVQLASAINSPEASGDAIQGAQANLISAFYHMPWRKAWFEKTILIKRLSRFGLHDLNEFQKVVPLMQLEKSTMVKPQELAKKAVKKVKDFAAGDEDDKLLYGIVSALSNTILYSPDDKVQQEAMKVIIQFATMDNEVVQYRVVRALEDIIKKGGREGLTARLIVEVFHVLPNIYAEKAKALVRQIRSEVPMQKLDENQEGSYFTDVLTYLVYYVAEIKSLEEPGGHSIVTALAASEENLVVETFFSWIKEYAPHYQRPDMYGRTPYHIAMEKHNNGVVKIVKEILTDININAKNYREGHTALHEAVICSYPEGVAALVEAGANPNARSKSGFTPLHLAVMEGSYDSVTALLEAGADPNAMTFDQKRPLDLLLEKDESKILKLLMSYKAKTGLDPCVTPIMAAAHAGAEECMIKLIRGRDKEPLSGQEALSILLYLTKGAKKKISTQKFYQFFEVELRNRPPHKEVFDQFPEWPGLKEAAGRYSFAEEIATSREKRKAQYGNTDFIELCRYKGQVNLLKGAVSHCKKPDSSLALSKKSMMNYVSEKKKQLEEVNFFGFSPLHTATLNCNYEAVKLLTEPDTSIDIDKGDGNGNTALHYAAWLRDRELIESLLSAGADPNRRNVYGETPLFMLTSKNGHRMPPSIHTVVEKFERKKASSKLLDLFAAYKADFSTNDLCGNNLLHRAVMEGCKPLIEPLCVRHPSLFWTKNSLGLTPFLDSLRNGEVPHMERLLKTFSSGDLIQLEREFFERTAGEWPLANCLVYANAPNFLHQLLQRERKLAITPANNPNRYTPIHIAAMKGCDKVIDIYESLHIGLGSLDAFGNSAAHIAAQHGQEAFLNKIALSNKMYSRRNSDGRMPLHLAAAHGSTAMLERLVASKNHCLLRDLHGETPLHIACRYGKIDNVQFLIEKNPRALLICNESGNPPLHLAAARGHLPCVKKLVEAGFLYQKKQRGKEERAGDFTIAAPLYEIENARGATPFIMAAQEGQEEVVKYLLSSEVGVDFRKRDFNGENCLHKATFRLNLPVVEMIIGIEQRLLSPEAGKRVYDTKDERGEIPFFELTKIGEKIKEEPYLVKAIMRAHLKADKELIRIRNELGQTFIHAAAAKGLYTLLDYLANNPQMAEFKKAAKWGAPDNHGNSPLHLAVRENHPEIVELLIKLGVPIDEKNDEGKTPLMLAVKHRDTAAATLLLNAGANALRRDERKRTVIHHLFSGMETPMPPLMRWLLEELLKREPKLALMRDEDKWTPLHAIAAGGHVVELDLLLKAVPKKFLQEYLWKRTKSELTAIDIAKQLSPNRSMASAIQYYSAGEGEMD